MKLRIALLASFIFTLSLNFAQDLGSLKSEKWATIHGNIGGGAWLYGVDGIPARRAPFSWFTSGNATLTLKGLALPFSFQYSEQQRDFRQPFNQFGVSPTYKWFKSYLGWRQMSFSRYTLDGHVFLGVGFEANPGKLRLGGMYGRFLKAVQEDSSQQVYNKVTQYPLAAYTRMGYSAKIGYGTEQNFLDLIYFKAKDDVNSIKTDPVKQLVSPAENAVLGIKLHLSPFKNFSIDGDVAMSAITRDIRGDSVAVEEKYTKYARIVMTPRLSTAAYYAGELAAKYKVGRFTLGLKGQRIMPDYRSFGTYYMQTDVQRLTFNPQYMGKKGKFMLNGSIGTEHDNLSDKKQQQTSRTIGNLQLTWRVTDRFGINGQFSNYGMLSKGIQKSISDTVLLNQITNNIMFVPYYILPGEKRNHTFMYMFSNQTLNDKNKINSQDFSMNLMNHTLSYSLSLNESRIRVDISAFTMTSEIAAAAGAVKSNGGSLGIAKSTENRKITTSLNATVSSNTYQGSSDGSTVQARWNNVFKVNKHHAFTANLTVTHNKTKSAVISKDFTEFLGMVMYNYMF